MLERAPLGGGCIGRIERIDTTAGPFVLKWLPDAPPDLFAAEADGLAALRHSGTPLVIPHVVTSSRVDADGDDLVAPRFLVLEYLPPGAPRPDFDDLLGQGLARLHQATAPRFGFARDTWCGRTRQPNPWTERWVTFYAVSRLGYQLDRAARSGRLDPVEARLVERVIDRLDLWLDEPAEGPALLHGDLWAGNVHVTADGRPALIDPAVYFGHREADLGMMTLFGGFSPRVFDAYHDTWPLDPGWRDRNGLYQLYHLLNHLNLFGRGYRDGCLDIARRYS